MKLLKKVILIILLPLLCFAQPSPQLVGGQNGEAKFYPSGIWHKNMELKCTIDFPDGPSNEFMDLRNVNSIDGNGNILNTYKFLASTLGQDYTLASEYTKNNYDKASQAKFYDVTNISSGIPKALSIRVIHNKNNTNFNNSTFYTLQHASMYQNPTNKHTYCVIGSDGRNSAGNTFKVFNDPITKIDSLHPKDTSKFARAIIIDLTEAMNFGSSSGEKEIVIDNLVDRSSAHINGYSLYTNKIYIGYILYDEKLKRLHTMGFDNPSGILAISPLDASNEDPTSTVQKKGYFELVNFSDIHLNTEYNSTTAFVVPTVLTGGAIESNLIVLETKVKYKNFENGEIDSNNIEIKVAGYKIENFKDRDKYWRNPFISNMSMNLKSNKITRDTIYKVDIQIDDEIIKYELEHPAIDTSEYSKYLPKPLTGNELHIQSQNSLRNILHNITSKVNP